MKSYSFLEEYQQKEVETMNRLVKKTKDTERKEELKASLLKASQEMKERRRHQEFEKRLSEIKAKEKEKACFLSLGYTCIILFLLGQSGKEAIFLEAIGQERHCP